MTERMIPARHLTDLLLAVRRFTAAETEARCAERVGDAGRQHKAQDRLSRARLHLYDVAGRLSMETDPDA